MMAVVPAFAQGEESDNAIVFAVVVCFEWGGAELVAGGVYEGNAVEEDGCAEEEGG